MKKHLQFFFFFVGFFLVFKSSEVYAQKADICHLSGVVFVEKSRNFAQYTVFVDDGSAAFADLNVVKMENRLFADKPGLWYFTDNRALADFTIFYEEKANFADFVIHFETSETFAGCNK